MTSPPAPPEGTPRHVTGTAEAEIAVSSLSGIAPSRILRHALVVADDEGELHVSTSCCKDELPELMTRAGLIAVHNAMQPGPCYHEGGEQQ